MRKIYFLLIATLWSLIVLSQTSKSPQLTAVRTSDKIKIDGTLNDPGWKSASRFGNLIEMRPTFNKPEAAQNKTELYFLYDDDAVYLGGFLHESSRDQISTDLAGRDNPGANDFVGVIFDTYQDRINGLGFYLTPLGEQFDVKYSIGSEDMSWNTVYQSEAIITDSGWSFEMRIPYSAIRFSKDKVQNWGLQILRRRSKTGQQYSWSPVDPAKFGFMIRGLKMNLFGL